jgi:hypothetical protein
VASEEEEEAEGGEDPLEDESRQEESEEDVGDEEMEEDMRDEEMEEQNSSDGLWVCGISGLPKRPTTEEGKILIEPNKTK